MKKFTVFFISICMLISFFPTAIAADTYKVKIAIEKDTIEADKSVSLSAEVTKNGSKLTAADLEAEGFRLWWWCDSWNNHSSGNNDAKFSNYDNGSGLSFTADAVLPSSGTYYLIAELKTLSDDKSLAQDCATFTVNYGSGEPTAPPLPSYGDIQVDRISNLPSDFIMGMDISSIISEFESGVTFKDRRGNTIDNVTDFCKLLADSGINHVRVRVWNNPYNAEGKSYGGGHNDVATAVKIAEGCAAAGIKMMIDFHCSDFWADPGKQTVPKAWNGYSVNQKADAVKNFISDSLVKIKAGGAVVDMVQVGNETTTKFVGESSIANICKLFSAGIEAVHEHGAKAVIHVTNPEKSNITKWAGNLNSNNVNYDILATSYYPYWHGTLNNLKSEMSKVKTTYGKDVMVAETSYAYTLDDSDGHQNTIGSESAKGDAKEPFTVQGQATALRNLMSAVNDAGGLGVFYWEPAWITVGDTTGKSDEEAEKQKNANNEKWETYGSGWASSFGGEYDSGAVEWHGGSAVDNEAMFYPDGTPTAGLNVWNYVKPNYVKTCAVTKVTPTDSGFDINVINIPSDIKAYIITAVYDNRKRLIDIAFSELNPETEVQKVDIKKSGDKETVKVFIWDSLNGMKPLTDSYKY